MNASDCIMTHSEYHHYRDITLYVTIGLVGTCILCCVRKLLC